MSQEAKIALSEYLMEISDEHKLNPKKLLEWLGYAFKEIASQHVEFDDKTKGAEWNEAGHALKKLSKESFGNFHHY